jgi:hypothetical protein
MDEIEELRALARKCRDLAAAILDEPTRQALESLAQHYERQASEQEANQPPAGPTIPLE